MSLIVGTSPGTFESLWFYRHSVELRYNDVEHIYYRVAGNRLLPQDGVTTIVKIPDKSPQPAHHPDSKRATNGFRNAVRKILHACDGR